MTTQHNSPYQSPKARFDAQPRLNRDKVVKFLMSDKFGKFIQERKTVNHSTIARELETFD